MACGSHADSCSITAQTKAGSSEWRAAASRAKPVNAEGISNTESYTAESERPFASQPARQNGVPYVRAARPRVHNRNHHVATRAVLFSTFQFHFSDFLEVHPAYRRVVFAFNSLLLADFG